MLICNKIENKSSLKFITLGLQEVEAPRISRQSENAGGKVVSPTHRPPLPHRRYP
jgi:hypothetical protein